MVRIGMIFGSKSRAIPSGIFQAFRSGGSGIFEILMPVDIISGNQPSIDTGTLQAPIGAARNRGEAGIHCYRSFLGDSDAHLTAHSTSRARQSVQPRASSLKRAMSSGSDAARPERKRRKGGGMRQLLSDSKIEEGQRFYRGMLAEDLTWTKRQAAAERVKEKLKLLVSWRTVQRHIIDPVLKNGR
jgi:hypothetical protein